MAVAVIPVHGRVGTIREQCGNLCVELGDIGEVLNEYFVSVFTVGKDDDF